MSLKKCPKHGFYNTIKCEKCLSEGIALCVHCGKDLTNCSIDEIIEHIKSHENIISERSKELLKIVDKFDYNNFTIKEG